MPHHINARYPFCYMSPVALLAFCLIFQVWGTEARVEFRQKSQVNPYKFGAFSPADGEVKHMIALADEDFCVTTRVILPSTPGSCSVQFRLCASVATVTQSTPRVSFLRSR